MTLAQVVIDVAAAVTVLAAVVYCLYLVVGWARRRQKRAYAIGAALAPFMALGNVVDPDFRIVHEAKQHRKGDEGEPGDPPNGDDESALAELQQSVPPSKPPITRVRRTVLRRRTREAFA